MATKKIIKNNALNIFITIDSEPFDFDFEKMHQNNINLYTTNNSVSLQYKF